MVSLFLVPYLRVPQNCSKTFLWLQRDIGASRTRSKADYYANHLFVSVIMNSVKGDESFLKSQAVPEHLREVEDPYRDEDNDQNRRRVPFRSQSEYRDDLGDEEEGHDASSNIHPEDSWEVYEERLTEAFKRIGKSEDDGFDKGNDAGNLSMTAVSEKDAYRQAAAHTLDALTQKVKIPVRPSRDAILSLGPLIFV